MEIETCLLIAGMAHRNRANIHSTIKNRKTAFPKGPDDVNLVQEIAICDSIVQGAGALLNSNLLELKFTRNGYAFARTPKGLAGTDYDNGFYKEPKAKQGGAP